ncbi:MULTISPECIES: CaiB/BaiF CoA transferase family protein [Arthrobacter]|uniref:Formyl-CoA transferase n=1 Tax=Arthrobacter psychrochitiniphilus TaxID=291045 RepID=A0A2V3DMX7_9MICC|nr:CoA transferase [Arthrobacter psychrochitiniphilus]NYG17899.1 formyl-CoA transferase [Arthrobacter psychrochitiniphilus]PXA64107.1 formyl-CoA transferase [Arthrobacter psychrochitiniphilus]
MTANIEVKSGSGPLSGLRVIEMGQLLAGPFCGQMLGDLGADVVKIEDPTKGDPLRQWGRQLPEGQSLWWSIVGRNKRSVTLNLREPEAQDIARKLLSTADVLIENFRPGTMERWGMGYSDLKELNPKLIMVRVSGFGQDGPYSQRAGYGAIGEAMGGLRYVVGDPSMPPSRVGISIGDTLAALFATIGALAAVHERETSGHGQVVDSSIYEAVLGVMESLVPEWQVSGYQRERTGAILPNVAPSNVYPTKDGKWVLIAANQDTVFGRLAVAINQPELASDARYATHGARGERQEELDGIIGEFTSTQMAEDLEALLEKHGVPAGKIFRPVDMLSDPQYLARESIISVDHPVLGPVSMQNVFPKLSRTTGTVRWPGPALGQHTQEVLSELGISDSDLSALRTRGLA